MNGRAHDSAGKPTIVQCSTGKVRFPNAARARQRLAEIQEKPDPTVMYLPCDVHRCRKCGGYHLTSKQGKSWKHGKRRR